MSKRDLWKRISNYQFEHIVQPELMDKVSAMFGGADASTQAFASKLALKQGWSRKFALRAPKTLDQSPEDYWGSDVPLYTFYSSNELDTASASVSFGGGGE